MQWWVTTGDRKPIGPVSTELLLQGIAAGEVPKDAFVCEVGGTSWKMIGSVRDDVESEGGAGSKRSEGTSALRGIAA